VKSSDDLVLLDKEETLINRIIYRINKTGKFCGKYIGVGKLTLILLMWNIG
jgi:hypothetical protein